VLSMSAHGRGEGSFMAFDQSKIGQLAAQLMENLEGRYSDEAEIGDVFLIVEVTSPELASEIAIMPSSARAHVNLGLLEAGRQIVSRQLGDA
jgi:hypothetical protein